MLSRRLFTAAVLATAPAGACSAGAARDGRLTFTSTFEPAKALGPGVHSLGGSRATLMFLPGKNDPPKGGYPMALALHGATQDAPFSIRSFRAAAEALGVVLIAPNSADATWDLSGGPRGADARTIEDAMNAAMRRAPINPRRLACAGFSDGASYALSLGLANGDLFSDVLAFSPGFMNPGPLHGHPHVFIAHGQADTILPFDGAQAMAKRLSSSGYDVQFYPFAGGHRPEPGGVLTGFQRFAGRGGRG